MKIFIIFDFDGVLGDTLPAMLDYARQACAQLGYPCEPDPADLEALEPMSFANLGRHLGVPEGDLDEFARLNFAQFAAQPQAIPIFPGMAELVLDLAPRAMLGLVTGNTRGLVAPFLEINGLGNCFGSLLTVEDSGDRATKVSRALEELGWRGEPAFMVGDALSDIQAARQVGIRSIAVSWGHQSPGKLAGAEPDYLVADPPELGRLLEALSAKSR